MHITALKADIKHLNIKFNTQEFSKPSTFYI